MGDDDTPGPDTLDVLADEWSTYRWSNSLA